MRTVCLLWLLVLNSSLPAQSGEDRPNIIVILTDDQRWDALGYAGNGIILTPEMDKLASQGLYFKNAFVTSPICAASRASILTGLYERSHGFTFGTPPLGRRHVDISYPGLLKAAGYRTGLFGKLGMQLADHSDSLIFDQLYNTGVNGYFRIDGSSMQHRHLTDLTTDKAIQFIRQTPAGQPFCLSISYNAAHADDSHPDQYFWPARLDSLYHGTDIPRTDLHGEEYHDALPGFLRDSVYMGNIRYRWRFDTPAKYQKMVRGYYRLVTTIDQNIGRIRKILDQLGIADNTVIILLSDNGYFLGERNLAGKWLMYEQSIRIPLIIYDPRSKESGTIHELALNIDISPTVLDYAGLDIPEAVQGKSLRIFGYDPPKDWRDSFLCEHLFEFRHIPKSEGIRTRRFKYFRYIDHPGSEEFYDLEKDPDELINLVADPDYSDRIEQLRRDFVKMTDSLQ